jgi:hypothetical protein
VILFARDGLLEMLEIEYYGDVPPAELPPPERLTTWNRTAHRPDAA